MGRGASCQDMRAQDVHLHRLCCVMFHHGHVLVRGGMKDHLRPEGLKHLLHPPLIPDVPRNEIELPLQLRKAAVQLQPKVVQLRFIDIEEDDLCRLICAVPTRPTRLPRSPGCACPSETPRSPPHRWKCSAGRSDLRC